MHASVNFLIFVLITLFIHLPSSNLLVNARMLPSTKSNGFLKVDLIHRDSPHSPYYNSSMSHIRKPRLGTSISRGIFNNRYSSDASTDSNNIDSSLTPNGGDYLMKISIGTPPMEFMANADTGSSLIWLQCTPCQSCIQQPSSSLLDPTQSSTYQPIPCNPQTCNYPTYNTQCSSSNTDINNNNTCSYDATYGGGLESSGTLATDTISFSMSSNTFPSSIIGCGFNQQLLGAQQSIPGDGIVGLGAGPLSLISQLGSQINNKFSYCLAPLSASVASKLTFGSDVTSRPGVVSTPLSTENSPEHYILTLDAISIGDDSSISVQQFVLIDSGTTLTYLPSDVYESIKSEIAKSIQLSPASNTGDYFCYEAELSDQGFNPPDVVFHFQGNADVVLKPINAFWSPQKGYTCLAIKSTDDGTYILGNIAQVNYEVEYDLQAGQVSFAPADCSSN